MNLYIRDQLPHLSRIEWLKINLLLFPQHEIPVFREILGNLPNIQILVLSQPKALVPGRNDEITDRASQTVISLPRLRLLSLELSIRQSWTFHAPNLDYLCFLDLGEKSFYDWHLLERINFSGVNNVHIGIHTHPKRFDQTHSAAQCISGSDRSQLDCSLYEKFHHDGLDSRAAVDEFLDLPPKNCFHFAIPWTDFQAYDTILRRAINLVELTLNYGAIKPNAELSSFLVQILNSVDTKITRLNVTRGRSFVEACTLLADGCTAPRLETFMYHNAHMVKITAFLPGRLKALQDARRDAGSSPLKILELRNFVDIPSERVQTIEALGIQLIQTA